MKQQFLLLSYLSTNSFQHYQKLLHHQVVVNHQVLSFHPEQKPALIFKNMLFANYVASDKIATESRTVFIQWVKNFFQVIMRAKRVAIDRPLTTLELWNNRQQAQLRV